MQSILSSFHLEIPSFSELLEATGGIVAGSAALAAYTATCPDTFIPNDLDIWVHSDFFTQDESVGPAPKYHPGVAVRLGYNYLFRYFFAQHGYTEIVRPVQSDSEYTSNPVFAILRSIQRFQHKTSGRVIQVMHCKVPVTEILGTFDLSVAQTWWIPSSHPSFPEGFLQTQDPVATQERKMYSLREPSTDREKERIAKYEARGFTLVANATRLNRLADLCAFLSECREADITE